MDFTHTEERRMLADTIRRFVTDEYPIDQRHKNADSENGFSKEFWEKFAELGLIGALFSEENGGFGGKGYDLAILFEELGRGIVVEPFLATLMAGTVLAEAGTVEQKALLENAIGGETLLAFAHSEPDSRYEMTHVGLSATPEGDYWVLNGRKAVVAHGDSADYLVVSTRTSGDTTDDNGISLFLIPADIEDLSCRGYPTVDGLHAAEVTFTNVKLSSSALIGDKDNAFPIIEKAIGAGVLALSAEALGAMDIAKDMTLDYLKTRTQFGRPIGMFQALQHRMADMMMEIEQMRSSVINAADRFEEDRKTREWALSAAKNQVGTVGRMVAEESIQMHGGIAMTWEYALGHFAKRIVMIDHMLGDADHHMARAIQLSRAAG